MVERVREDLMVAVRKRVADKGVGVGENVRDYPIMSLCEEAVPFVGSVLAGRRVIGRDVADRIFKKQR